ncbi:hypothetical protein KJ059_17835 [Myxococcota bacterium]|nr:hypothetical protein [Myxococcota bacterium]MCZ7617744.1 hypothetical protein [Myxococcota bacterium]
MSLPRAWTVVETQDVQDCRVFRVQRTLARSPRDGSAHPLGRIEADPCVNVAPVTDTGEIRHALVVATLLWWRLSVGAGSRS